MTEIPISPNIWKLAAAILTSKQLLVLELREKHGYSWNQLAITLNTVRSNVREHHRAASKNLLDAIEAAGGDVELALNRATLPAPTIEVRMETNRVAFAQPRPTSEETPEEKLELDRLWRDSAQPRPDSEKKEIA